MLEIEEMKKMVTNDNNTYKSVVKLTKVYKNGGTDPIYL